MALPQNQNPEITVIDGNGVVVKSRPPVWPEPTPTIYNPPLSQSPQQYQNIGENNPENIEIGATGSIIKSCPIFFDEMHDLDTVIYCPQCMLVYKPDPNQHMLPGLYCPRCGYKLLKATMEEFMEKRQYGGGTDGGSGAKFF